MSAAWWWGAGSLFASSSSSGVRTVIHEWGVVIHAHSRVVGARSVSRLPFVGDPWLLFVGGGVYSWGVHVVHGLDTIRRWWNWVLVAIHW